MGRFYQHVDSIVDFCVLRIELLFLETRLRLLHHWYLPELFLFTFAQLKVYVRQLISYRVYVHRFHFNLLFQTLHFLFYLLWRFYYLNWFLSLRLRFILCLLKNFFLCLLLWLFLWRLLMLFLLVLLLFFLYFFLRLFLGCYGFSWLWLLFFLLYLNLLLFLGLFL